MIKKLLTTITTLSLLLVPTGSYAILNIDDNANLNNTTYYLEHEGVIPDCGTGNGAAGPTSTLTGSDHVSAVYNYFIGKGLTPEQASGIIGNMIVESYIGNEQLEFTPKGTLTPANQITAVYPNDGWGIVQWTPHTKFTNSATANGKDPNSMAVQLDFLWGQLSGSGFGSDQYVAGVLGAIKGTTTPQDAAYSWEVNFENPLDVNATLVERQTNAIAAYQFMKNGVPLPPNILANINTNPIDGAGGGGSATASCPTQSPGGGSGVYKNPFRDVHNLVPMRIDGGVDYGGDGPIYAVGDGVITYINRSGSYALNYMAYKLTSGPAAGLSIFVAENCDFPGKVGDIVTSSTVVCNLHAGYPYMEIGWSNLPTSYYPPWYDGGLYQTTSTNAGRDMNKFLVALCTPSGIDYGGTTGTTPPGWPVWPGACKL